MKDISSNHINENDIYVYKGRSGNSLIGKVYNGKEFKKSDIPLDIFREWVGKKWLVQKGSK